MSSVGALSQCICRVMALPANYWRHSRLDFTALHAILPHLAYSYGLRLHGKPRADRDPLFVSTATYAP